MNNLKIASLVLGSSLITGVAGLMIGSAIQTKCDDQIENELIDSYHQRLTEMEGELQDKEIQIKTLQEELEEKEDELQHLKELNTEKDAKITKLREEVNTLKGEIESEKV